MKIAPYVMLAEFSVRNLATSLVLLPIALAASFAGIWLVKSVPTTQFYRITYALLFVLGCALLWQGGHDLMRGTH